MPSLLLELADFDPVGGSAALPSCQIDRAGREACVSTSGGCGICRVVEVWGWERFLGCVLGGCFGREMTC